MQCPSSFLMPTMNMIACSNLTIFQLIIFFSSSGPQRHYLSSVSLLSSSPAEDKSTEELIEKNMQPVTPKMDDPGVREIISTAPWWWTENMVLNSVVSARPE